MNSREGTRVFRGHNRLETRLHDGSSLGISEETFKSAAIPIEEIWKEVGAQVNYDEDKIGDKAKQLLVVMGGLKQIVDIHQAEEFAPKIVEDVMEARKKAEATGVEKLPKDYLDMLTANYLLQIASDEFRSEYERDILFELIEAKVKDPLLTKKHKQTLREVWERKGELRYKKDWQGKAEKAVKALTGDLAAVGAGLWEGTKGENYVEEIENTFSMIKSKLPRAAKQEFQEMQNKVAIESFDKYAQQFGERVKNEMEAGRNGKNLMKQVSEFCVKMVRARNLLDTKANKLVLGEKMEQLYHELKKYKRGLYSAMMLVGWHEGEAGLTDDAEGNRRVVRAKVAVGNGRYLYLHDMVKTVGREVIDAMGTILSRAKNASSLEDLLENNQNESTRKMLGEWPVWVLSRVADCFADSGYLTKLKSGKYSLKRQKGRRLSSLDYDSLRSVMLAHKYMYFGPNKKPEINSLADVTRIYERNNELIKITELELEVPNAKIDTMAKVEFGYEDTDVKYIESKLKALEKMKPEDRPAVMIISDIVFGTFEVTKKSKRWTLVDEMKSLDTQFAAAGKLIDRLKGMGIKVVVMKGSDAWDISDDHAVMNVQRWDSMAAPLTRHDKRFLNYHDVDRIKQTKAYDQYLKFQWDVVYEYCLRAKRSMMTADEVAEKTGNRVRMEEPLMLIDAYEKLTKGEELPPEYLEVLDIESIPLRGKVFNDGLYVVDDAHLTLRPENGEKPFTIDLWDRFTFSPDPLIGSPLSALKSVVGAMASEGAEIHDLTAGFNQRWGVASGAGKGSMVTTLPGIQTYQRHQGSHNNATGNSSLRQRMRGTLPVAATTSFEKVSGHFKVEFDTDLLREKSHATNPSAIVVVTDTQIGGDTAKQDLIPKLLDYAITKVAPENETYVLFNGDITHGLNFPGSAIVNGPTRLNSTRKQNLHGTHLLEESLGHFNSQQLGRVKRWLNLAGNHQWNTLTKLTGELYIQWIESTIGGILKSAYGPQMTRDRLAQLIKTYDTMLVKDGGDLMLDAWTAVEPVGAYQVMAQHLILDKMAKSGGDLPILQYKTFVNGVGDLAKKIDVSLYGHWHHRQFMLKGNKVAAVAPALAGQSWYEWIRGYRPEVGALVVYLGGGRPVTLDFVSAKALYRHEIKDGAFSPTALKDSGFVTDPGFIPGRHGFGAPSEGPHDAIQKKIWKMVDEINDKPSSTLGDEPESWTEAY